MLEVLGYLMLFVCFGLIVLSLWVPDHWEDKMMAFFAAVLVSAFLGIPGVRLGPGLFPNYATVTRDGYLMRASVTGVVFKTCELEVVTGFGGDAASLTHEFSAPAEFCEEATPFIGKQVRVNATRWLVSPWRVGDSPAVVQNLALTP